MFSLFSVSNNKASGPKPIDLQLISDAELLKIWDQTQSLIGSMEEKDISSHLTHYYSFIIETELQNRAQLKPTAFFQLLKNDEQDLKYPLKNQILTKNMRVLTKE